MAYLTFHFPWNVDAASAIKQVADHFAVSVVIGGQPATVPDHIKQAVERIGMDNPASGDIEPSAAVAFGGLLNGASGNAPATSATVHSTADVATSTIVPVVSPVTSATPPTSSVPVLPPAPTAVAPVAPAVPTNPASNAIEFDSSGLAYDERIHSGNRTKTPGGEWRSKKGTDKSLIKAIELELRARYPNGGAPVVSVSPTNAPVSVDPLDRKAAALTFAHAEGLRVAGAPLIDGAVIVALNNGQSATLSPEQSEWYSIYFAKRNAAYAEYMGNVASDTLAVSASPTPITPVPVAPAAPASATVASPTQAAGTAAPAATAQGVELDGAGLPWDARINIGARLKDTAGVWVQRFDVSPEVKLSVIAELRASLQQAPNVAASPSIAPNGAAGSIPVAPMAVTAAEASMDFSKLMQWIVSNQIAKRIAPTAGPDAARDLGFASQDGNGQLVLMRERSEAWPYVVQILQGQGAI